MIRSLIDYVHDVISQTKAKVYIGTDSAVKGEYVQYAVVIALRYENKGAHVLYRKIKIPRSEFKPSKGDAFNFIRLQKETEFSVELANFLADSGVNIEAIELDYNQDRTLFSHKLISSCEGWVKGLGYKSITKPEEMIAVNAADKICNT